MAGERTVRVAPRPRILVYSHDSYGLGHLRRNLLIAGRLATLPGAPSVLVLTGSPRAQSFSLPAGVDTVKLPAATKDGDGRYRSRTIGFPIDALVSLRRDIAAATLRSFQPDLVLVDHAPTGLAGELTPLLHALSAQPRRPALVLGLRDIVDEASRVDAEWERDGVWPLLQGGYDRVLVYGDPRLGTTATDLDLDWRLDGKVRHVGFLARPELSRSTRQARPNRTPTVVVTAGGGGDGHPLFRAYAEYLETETPTGFRSVVVTGPLMSRRRQAELAHRFRRLGRRVEMVEFTEHMERLMTGAAALVGMAGYNTVVEALCARTPALLVPREAPRREQLLRATRVSSLPGIDVCPMSRLDAARIGRFVHEALSADATEPAPVDLDGLDGVAAEVSTLLSARRALRRGPQAGGDVVRAS